MIHIYITYADLRASKGEGKSWKKRADHAEMLRSLLGGSAGCSKAMGGYLTATWLPLRWEACYAYVCIYVIPTKLVDFDRVGRFCLPFYLPTSVQAGLCTAMGEVYAAHLMRASLLHWSTSKVVACTTTTTTQQHRFLLKSMAVTAVCVEEHSCCMYLRSCVRAPTAVHACSSQALLRDSTRYTSFPFRKLL